jgi:hypothetical protein
MVRRKRLRFMVCVCSGISERGRLLLIIGAKGEAGKKP